MTKAIEVYGIRLDVKEGIQDHYIKFIMSELRSATVLTNATHITVNNIELRYRTLMFNYKQCTLKSILAKQDLDRVAIIDEKNNRITLENILNMIRMTGEVDEKANGKFAFTITETIDDLCVEIMFSNDEHIEFGSMVLIL